MFGVHDDLHIVAGHGLPAFAKEPGIRVNGGNLAVTAIFKLLLQGFFLGLFGLQ